MQNQEKKRLNLYIDRELLRFAKNWSYVTNVPISRMLEEYLSRQKDLVDSTTPFQWLNDPVINPSLPPEDNKIRDIEEYLRNKEEQEFCRQNPDHPRAKIRKTILLEQEKQRKEKFELQKEEEKELIRRWMKVFPGK